MLKKVFQNYFCGRHLLLFAIMLGISANAFSQQAFTIKGKVVDAADGEPLAGVSILVNGTAAAATDGEGVYSINASPTAKLLFTYVGYADQSVDVANRNVINISLASNAQELDELVVIGYGSVKRSDATGSVTSVNEKTLQERPVQNVVQALQGKASGLDVTSNMKPGELPPITIRGNRSMQASNQPLYVVDGIPLAAGSMADYNPNDITSVEILKDASATAIYGSRGANGVILISTKKGAVGKVTVGFNSSVTLDSYKSLSDFENGGEYIDRQRASLMNGRNYNETTNKDFNQPTSVWFPDPALDIQKMGLGIDPVALESVLMGYEWVDGVIGGTVATRATTAEEQAMGWPAQVPIYNSANVRSFDWRDAAIRQGVTQNHQLSLSAGSETSRIYTSFGYLDQLGVQRDQDYKRYNVIINGDITPNKWLTVGTSINGTMSTQNFGITAPLTQQSGPKDLYSRAASQYPYAMPTDASGNPVYNPGGTPSLWNPLIDIDQSLNERRVASASTNLYGEIKFTPWLKYRLNLGIQLRQNRAGAWTGPDATSHLIQRPNTASYNTDQRFALVAENILSADKTIGIHTFGITALQSAQKYRQEGINMAGSGMIYPSSKWYDIASNIKGNPDTYGTNFTENTLASYMGRVNYSLLNKYLLTVSGRWDGASVLAPGNKWDFFPSFALAWKLQEEAFMKQVTWVDELKLRFGYGATGNSSVDPYTTSGPISKNPYVFGSTPAIGYLPQIVPNPELRWERTAQSNLGLDFSVLNSRLTGSIELYNSHTSNLILNKTLPAVSGFISKIQNIGKTSNRGLEITLSSTNIQNNDFSWTTDVSFATNREKIDQLLTNDENGKPQDMLANRWFIGQPTQVYYSYQENGIWQNTPDDLAEMAKFNANGHRFYPGTVRVTDLNGDYKITGDDMTILGSNRPKWSGGITNNFSYKGVSLSFFVFARIGQLMFAEAPIQKGDMWSWDNPGGHFPMPNSGNVENNANALLYHDASFVAVRNISLSYNIPVKWLKSKVNNLQVSAQVLNPFLFGGDAVKLGLNPEDVTNWDIANTTGTVLGGQNNNTIMNQSFVFGLRAGF